MIYSVTVTNHLGAYATMELKSPEKSGLCLLSMDGISTNEANVNITDIGTTDGSYYNSSRVPSRDISMSIKLLPFPTIEDCRHTFYRLFQPKWPVQITFHTDTRDCYITGYVESAPVEIFSSNETAQVSIICPDPYFHDVNNEETVFSSITDNFVLPLYKEDTTQAGGETYIMLTGDSTELWTEVGSVGSGHAFTLTNSPTVSTTNTPVCSHAQYTSASTGKWGQFNVSPGIIFFDTNGIHTLATFTQWLKDNHPIVLGPTSTQASTIEFGMITYYTEKNIYYEGEDEIGVTIKMHAIGNVGNITLYNADTLETMSISSDVIQTMTGSGISAMDDIVITTSPGEKAVTLTRNGVTTNILNALGRSSDWFMLANGDNHFTYTATSGGSNLIFSISHRNIYNGV